MAGDIYWSDVVLAMHMDGTNGSTTFADETGKTVTANGNTQISTAQSKFGGGSAYFDGSSDYLSVSNDAGFDFGSGNFTVECWVYVTSLAGQRAIISKRVDTNADHRWIIAFINTNGTVQVQLTTNGSSWAVSAASSTAVSTNTWTHIAVVRNSSDLSVYVGGTKNTLSSSLSGSVYVDTSPLIIGQTGTSGIYTYPMLGYIDDLRITKGVARYTTSYTPPTETFPDYAVQISGTVKNDANAGAIRTIVAFDRSAPTTTVVTTTSASDGTYTLNCKSANEHAVIALDDAAGTTYNDLVKRATPA